MANTLAEETIAEENIYGITPKMRKAAREKLERLIKEQGVKPFTEKDFYQKSETGQPQEEIQAEVDDFMRLREEWREEDRKLQREID